MTLQIDRTQNFETNIQQDEIERLCASPRMFSSKQRHRARAASISLTSCRNARYNRSRGMSRAAVVRLLRSRSAAVSHAAAFGSGCHPIWVGKYSRSPLLNTHFISTQFPIFQKRWASHASNTEDDSKLSIGPQKDAERSGGEKETGVVYYGPISSTIKKVKLLSLSTCCLSVSLGPVITFMTSPDLNVILKGAVAASVIFFSATTTGVLHWFVSPYVHKLKWQPGSDTFEVEMMTWLATYTPR
uniref:Transmembrane protein n=1 Tax=Kalanchoe fedtschenkoi TaxID=63787 RepID=A0A7N0TLM4_KALFE